VVDSQTQQVLAGTRNPLESGSLFSATNPFSNTTIAVVATNAALSKEAINKVAQMAHNGLAQAIRPAHTMFDGDTIFALASRSSAQTQLDPLQASMIGAAAANTLARAIIKAIRNATTLHGVPAAHP
jgi:L-aminopeptidase/D-esterase-like protein